MKIREGAQQDLPRVLELIKELAEYEKASREVINTVEQMQKDGKRHCKLVYTKTKKRLKPLRPIL